MNTEVVVSKLDGAVASLIDKVLAGVDTGVGFMEAQLPEYVTQLLMWHGVRSGVLTLIATVIFISWAIVSIRLWKADKSMDEFATFGVVVLGGMCVTVASLMMFNLAWLQIWIAPKVWLVEYAASLVK